MSLADEVREVAEHLQHAASLAIIASQGEEPARGARHITFTIAELREKLQRLELVALGTAPYAICVASVAATEVTPLLS